MTQIIDAIDDYTRTYFNTTPDRSLLAFGLCDLDKKTSGGAEQPIPVKVSSKRQVSIDDRFEVVTWMRVNGSVKCEENTEWSFGKRPSRFVSVPIRLVFAHDKSIGENVVYEFMQEFPSKLSVPDYNFVFINQTQEIETNRDIIYETELGKTAYEKYVFTWNIYAINLNIEFIVCEGQYRILEDGTIRILE